MVLILCLILILVFFLSSIKKLNNKKNRSNKFLINRFRKKFKRNTSQSRRNIDSYSNKLLINPKNNIEINPWDKEEVLKEKAEIHRIRLSKFGKSKMNGQIFYKGPKGGVFTLSSKGNKKYV